MRNIIAESVVKSFELLTRPLAAVERVLEPIEIDKEIKELAMVILFGASLPLGVALGAIALVQTSLMLLISSVALSVLGVAAGIRLIANQEK